MIRRIEEAREIAAVSAVYRTVAEDEVTFKAQWLADTGARVVAQESGRHLESEEVLIVAHAFFARGVDRLLAVVTDSLAVGPEAYAIDASTADLAQICDELVGVNFLLVDESARQCILFTTRDFKLVAGPVEFVAAVVGSPEAARDEFLEFAIDQPDALRIAATRAAGYMSWIDSWSEEDEA